MFQHITTQKGVKDVNSRTDCPYICPSVRILALGSNQPLKDMNTRNIFLGVNVAGA